MSHPGHAADGVYMYSFLVGICEVDCRFCHDLITLSHALIPHISILWVCSWHPYTCRSVSLSALTRFKQRFLFCFLLMIIMPQILLLHFTCKHILMILTVEIKNNYILYSYAENKEKTLSHLKKHLLEV